MIIFNLDAILIALLSALLSLPFLGIYYFGGMNDDILIICISWMILVASFIGKASGTVGRLFFIPMWLLSIPLPFIVTYGRYGWTGIGVTFGIFIGFVGLLLGFMYYVEKKRLNNLRSEKIEFPDRETDPEAYWEVVKEKFFSPTFIKMTPEIGRFNIRVAEALQRDNVELTTLEAYKQEMAKAGSKRKKIDSKAEDNLMEEIDQKIIAVQEAKELLEKVSG
ncbi:hypothetical protein U8527_18075 [Kordia algicida OT-1]|uniref:Uncharacterized protein n=1 Tax=Kordia algicida OT-1 TaxID=391587 RepID=A9DIH0_9FLAO|nr:hypothetical protein [Kordia algicida]EDP97899.1 hypothetical protein KAOT1_11817 [Kordia algicida OT-1]